MLNKKINLDIEKKKFIDFFIPDLKAEFEKGNWNDYCSPTLRLTLKEIEKDENYKNFDEVNFLRTLIEFSEKKVIFVFIFHDIIHLSFWDSYFFLREYFINSLNYSNENFKAWWIKHIGNKNTLSYSNSHIERNNLLKALRRAYYEKRKQNERR